MNYFQYKLYPKKSKTKLSTIPSFAKASSSAKATADMPEGCSFSQVRKRTKKWAHPEILGLGPIYRLDGQIS